MGKSQIYLKKYKQEGHLKHEYNGLLNLVNGDNEIVDLKSKDININLEHPVDIQCQPSYDGTVNLILNDDVNPPRIINSRFSVIEDNKYKIINRNQLSQTNLYSEKQIDSQSRLFRNINKIPKINLLDIHDYGQLTGGNYVFYIKYADNDYNQTDIVCESGLINVFKGNTKDVSSISGTMLDEVTDKVINLRISNIDTSFAKVYVYYTRYTTDLSGAPSTRTYSVVKPYDIKYTYINISLNGFEEVEEIEEEQLNIKYNLVTNVKTQTQVQNMLFFGNVQGVVLNNKDLQNISYFINVDLKQKSDSIGYLDEYYKPKLNDDIKQTEYYNPLNTYYSLGYWPDEVYRLGIVYIMTDDSLSPVYNLRGCEFLDTYNNLSEKGRNIKTNSAYKNLYETETKMNYIPSDIFIDREIDLSNTKGVFKLPGNVYVQDYANKTTSPLYFDINLSQDVKDSLLELKVKGFFIVRQKRIPITLAQGLSIGVDKSSFIPMLHDTDDNQYFTESFISKDSRKLSSDFGSKRIISGSKQTSGLLCLEASMNKTLQSNFNGLNYSLQKYNINRLAKYKNTMRSFYMAPELTGFKANDSYVQGSILYIPTDVPLKYANSYGFSTRAGTMEDVKQIGFFSEKNFSKDNSKLVRGVFTPFLGINKVLDDNCIYNIKIPNYSNSFKKDYFLTRANDNSQYYAITDRYEMTEDLSNINAYRGDCFTNTITMKMQSNFIDSDVPVSEIIVSPSTWSDNYNGYEDTSGEKWNDMNRADINSVPLGHWVTYKCLSNYNLGLRAEDKTNVEEMALMGNPRSFYPLSNMTTASSCKIADSTLLNNGYNSTVSRKRHYLVLDVPYIKDMFDNRIMFSNIQVDDDFKNAYRIFQGLSYKDIDRQYGAIVKLISWGVDLLCIFEHGIGVIPINEKALVSTNTGQSIHMYGAGVIQNQISLVSPDFGSTWLDSIIRTPIGVYGVDTYAKKIWRYTQQKGFELLSDVKVQKFLNENINLNESDKYPIISLKNVKTHYNNYKGDVMFTFYNKDKEWNLCYNERMEKWITKYSWTPVYSENVNNIFYSLDNDKSQILSLIYYNKLGMNDSFIEDELNTSTGLRIKNNEWNYNRNYSSDIKLIGYDFYTTFDMEVTKISTSYLDKDDIEITKQLDTSIININGVEGLTKTINIDRSNLFENNELKYYYLVVDVLIKPTVKVELKDENGKVIIENVVDSDGGITPAVATKDIIGQQFYDKFCIVLNYNELSNVRTDKENSEKDKYNLLLKNGFYVHGRAGIFDEIEYTNEQISPAKWYDKQHPFEFEFVVNNLTGMHKIFNDLVIISNNVEPELFSFEIEGDVYNFNKANIYNYSGDAKEFKDSSKSQSFENKTIINNNKSFANKVDIVYDPILTQYNLKITQDCKNMKDVGRLKGNIQYKEGSWYSVIEPIYYKDKFLKDDVVTTSDWKNTRIRDKYMKVRVKYKGDKLVIITALKTLMTLSYA